MLHRDVPQGLVELGMTSSTEEPECSMIVADLFGVQPEVDGHENAAETR